MNITELNEALEAFDLAQDGEAINLDQTMYTPHNWAIEYLPLLFKAVTLLRDLYPHLEKLVGAMDLSIDTAELLGLSVIETKALSAECTANTITKIKKILDSNNE